MELAATVAVVTALAICCVVTVSALLLANRLADRVWGRPEQIAVVRRAEKQAPPQKTDSVPADFASRPEL